MRVNMISLSPKRARVRTILWLVFSIALLSSMAGVPFTTSVVYAFDPNSISTDVNGDGVVNILDMNVLAIAFGSYPRHLKWNPRADVNDDDLVDIFDLMRVAQDYGARAYTAVERLWSADSYWYMKIKDNPKLHPDNDKMIDWLMDYHSDRPYINWAGWTNAVYDCYEDTPVYHILDTDNGKYYDVPFPDPYPIEIPPDTDASVTIIDWYRGNVWDLWHVEATGGTYRVGDHMTLDLGGDGLWPAGGSWGSGGSGTATVAFLIRPEEIEAGVINHALGCCMKTAPGGKYTTMTGNFVSPPAAHTDRGNLAGNAIPEGARIQLDPAIDLDSLGLGSTGKIIAKAMQDYGIVAAEAGGNWAIYAEHDLSANWNPPSMSGTLLNPIADLVTDSYNPWRVIDFDLYPTVDDLSEYE